MLVRHILPAALGAALAALPAAAQGGACEGRLVADLGFARMSVSQGSIHVRDQDGRRSYEFSREPTLSEIGRVPGSERLREGDVLVAVDGRPITSREAGERVGAAPRGERVRLTVRRDGRLEEVEVVAGERCVAVPRAPAPPRPPRTPAPARPGAPPRAPAPAPAPAPPAPPVPPAAPAPPAAVLPGGWFGFGIQCRDCGASAQPGRPAEFRFATPPEVVSVEPGTPAARAGMQRGDVLTHLDGVPLTTPEGWRRFAAIEPRQQVRWTYTRDGRTRNAVMFALARPDAGRAPVAAADAQRLRYSGRVGDVRVEARGAPVTVTRDPATGETVIRSADLTVRLRPEG